MRIGFAQNKITPTLNPPVYLAGFGNNRVAHTIHDDLYARALAIQDNQIILVMVALDLIGFFRPDVYEVIDSLKENELFMTLNPRVLIASTHTHHGPDTMGLWGPDLRTSGVNPDYMAEIKKIICNTILSALKNPTPAGLKSTSVRVPGVVKNARNPEILDEDLTIVQFSSAEDHTHTLATLLNFPCHPEVLWDQNPHISSDYVHFLRAEVEKQTGAPCVFFSGALGGMMTPDVKDHSFAEAEQMGIYLAQAGLNAITSAPSTPAPSLFFQKNEIKPKLTNILYKLAFKRKILPDVRDQDGRIITEVNLIKIGETWFATVPGELLPKLGLQIKVQLLEAGAKTVGVIGLANDELGYILPVEDFKYPWNPFRPGKHYEETNSIGKEIAPKVMEGIAALLAHG